MSARFFKGQRVAWLGRVLVACEYSGIVRDAFAALGWDAWSCDILPSETPGNHVQGDVTEIINQEWDIIIAHPPCTYLTVTANKWLKDQPPRKSGTLVGQARRDAREEAIAFFMLFANCKCPHIAIENPIGCMSTRYRKPDQIVQPWQIKAGSHRRLRFDADRYDSLGLSAVGAASL